MKSNKKHYTVCLEFYVSFWGSKESLGIFATSVTQNYP